MKVYIIGTGMEGCKTLTAEARKAIVNADLLIGAQRMLEPFSDLKKEQLISRKSDEIAEFMKGKRFETAAILMSGDCGFYSGAEKLITSLSDYETEIISGISSPQYLCSKIKKPWQNMKFVSLHGANGNIVRNVCRNEYCFFLLGGDISPAKICGKLCKYGRANVRVYIGENLGYDNEKIYSGTAADFMDAEWGKLSVMVTENPDFEKFVPSGINDSEFIRDSVPMTKSEIRSIAVSKLDIGSDDICWDIGCGSGSVSVEMAMQCFDGRVYAVDKNKDAVSLTKENARKFGCDNVEIISGNAPEILSDFPAPDKVFVGGSSGTIKEILSLIYEKNSSASVIITAVSLETLNAAIDAFELFGAISPEITQIAVTRTKRPESIQCFRRKTRFS